MQYQWHDFLLRITEERLFLSSHSAVIKSCYMYQVIPTAGQGTHHLVGKCRMNGVNQCHSDNNMFCFVKTTRLFVSQEETLYWNRSRNEVDS